MSAFPTAWRFAAVPLVVAGCRARERAVGAAQRPVLSDGARRSRPGALEDCKAKGYAVSVVVVDRGGDVMVALRANDAGPHTMENARRKAYTARTFKMTSEEFAKRMETDRGAPPAGDAARRDRDSRRPAVAGGR